MARLLSTNTNIEEVTTDGKIVDIGLILNLNPVQLKNCQHKTDIKKTCRNITKCLFPNIRKRAKMLVSSMNRKKLTAIHGNCIKNYLKMIIFLLF
jgi:hypothetical protein